MPISRRNDKLIEVLNAIRRKMPKISPYNVDTAHEYISMLEQIEPREILSEASLILPIEDVKTYSLLSNDPVKKLTGEELSVLAIDSSYFVLGPHFHVRFAIGNVGYWVVNYSNSNGFMGNKADIFEDVKSRIEMQIKIRALERETAREILEQVKTDMKIFMLDEALNMNYTASWSSNRREEMIRETVELIKLIDKLGGIPIGIFYTRASDIIRGLSAYYNKPIDEFTSFSDRYLMDIFLSEYQRSPLFSVNSKILRKAGIKLLTMYVKISKNNVLRIEMFEKHRDLVDIIHLVIVATSILGKGYPLPLQRAHENAILNKEDRLIIEGEIAKLLDIPAHELLLSKKEVSKRWPIA